jgi:hypothetical protein
MPAKKTTPPNAVYQLKITLRGVRPPIWRRVLVGDTITLGRLHALIQALMGWEDEHLHQFDIGGEKYGEATVEGYRRVRDEHKFKLGELVTETKAKFLYLYDFSVNWEFEILVEEITPPQPDQVLPLCSKGKRAAPPEHIGGAWGYQALLEAKENPRHPERTRFAELIAAYDPEALDIDAINGRLRKLK